jgi:hypothetical protein
MTVDEFMHLLEPIPRPTRSSSIMTCRSLGEPAASHAPQPDAARHAPCPGQGGLHLGGCVGVPASVQFGS